MKKSIISGIIVFAIGLLSPQTTQAQGTMTYLSNLGQSGGAVGVGSNSWLSVLFTAGTNAGGYLLDNIQLEMGTAFGSPSGFTIMLYSGLGSGSSGSIGTWSGSADPSTNGIYIYTSATQIVLQPNHFYFIVLSAETPYSSPAIANPIGYLWARAQNNSSQHNPIGGWTGGNGYSYSTDFGSSWNFISGIDPQYAINATAVPEPGVLGLFGLGGLGFLWQRRKAKTA